MRKLYIGVLIGAIALVGAAVALAQAGGTTTTFSANFTKKKVLSNEGLSYHSGTIDKTNTANNQQPDAPTELDLSLPKGSKIDSSGAAACKAVDLNAANPCPTNTIIGTGKAVAKTRFNGTQDINGTVTAYNRKGGLFLYINAPDQHTQIVLSPTWSGRTLKTPLPPNCIPPDHASNGDCVTPTGQISPRGEVILTDFRLTTTPQHKGKHDLLKAPKTCPKSKKWVFSAAYTYKSGAHATYKSNSACKA